MSCLGSKHELLQVADHVIAHYYQRVPFVRNHPQAIDLDMLVMELMGGSIKMFPLSKDGSMLGMTAHERLIIRMELKDGTIIRDTLRPKDIVIDILPRNVLKESTTMLPYPMPRRNLCG